MKDNWSNKIAKTTEHSVSEIHKFMEIIIMNLINSRKMYDWISSLIPSISK